MGVALLIALEGEGVVREPRYEGKYLMDDPSALDSIAVRAGARPMISFLGDTAGTSDWNDVLETVDGDQWFEPDEGLRTFRALRMHAPSAFAAKDADWVNGLLWTVDALTTILDRAKREGRRFQLWGSW